MYTQTDPTLFVCKRNYQKAETRLFTSTLTILMFELSGLNSALFGTRDLADWIGE